VRKVEPNRQLKCLGRFGFPFIFDGEHSWTIEPLGDRKVRLIQQQELRGFLVPFGGNPLSSTERGFNEMNTTLKRRVES
jgi:hypothetical protein